jgi:ATP-dependent Clp protease ATP-binding subunit ClpA
VFERLTPGGMQAIVCAQRESRAFGHADVAPYHLLLGLLAEEEELVARRALLECGASIDAVRDDVASQVRRETQHVRGQLPFASDLVGALEHADAHARNLGHPEVNTGDLLLALFDHGGDVVTRIFDSRGVTRARCCDSLAHLDPARRYA